MERNLKAPVWLCLALALLIAVNMVTVIGLPSLADSYAALGVAYPTALRLILALAWIVLLSAVLIGLWRSKRLARWITAPLLTAYAAVGVLMQVLFARSIYSRNTVGFDIVIAVLTLIPVWWLALRRGWLRRGSNQLIHPPQETD
jgi:hypothetical protein